MGKAVDLSEFYDMTVRKTCRVEMALEAVKDDPEKTAKLEAALAVDAGRIPNSVVARWIEQNIAETQRPTAEGVGKHRKGECSCGRS